MSPKQQHSQLVSESYPEPSSFDFDSSVGEGLVGIDSDDRSALTITTMITTKAIVPITYHIVFTSLFGFQGTNWGKTILPSKSQITPNQGKSQD